MAGFRKPALQSRPCKDDVGEAEDAANIEEAGLKSRPYVDGGSWFELLGRGSDVGDGNIPVGEKDFEAALFFLLISGLIGEEFFHGFFFSGIRGGGDGGVFESDGDAVIPARIFGHVIGGSLDFDGEEISGFDALLKERIVVFEEEIQEFLLMAPLNFVVVLHGVGLVGGALGWRALGEECGRGEEE